MVTYRLLRDNHDMILRIATEHGASAVQVFGSRARGSVRQDSDLDLLVRLDADRSLLDIVALKQDLEDALGCSVDVVTESSISPHMRDEILREAVPL